MGGKENPGWVASGDDFQKVLTINSIRGGSVVSYEGQAQARNREMLPHAVDIK
jgi:hypothetical protein